MFYSCMGIQGGDTSTPPPDNDISELPSDGALRKYQANRDNTQDEQTKFEDRRQS